MNDEKVFFETISETQTLLEYPIECFYMDGYPLGTSSQYHWHYYCEIIFVNSGGFTLIINNIKHELKTGDLVYINPKQIHCCISSHDCKTTLTVIKFDQDILKSSFNSYTETRYLYPFFWQSNHQYFLLRSSDFNFSDISELFKNTLNELNNKTFGYEYAIHNNICRLILILIRSLYLNHGESFFNGELQYKDIESLYLVFEYIKEHFAEEIDIDYLLTLCHLSYSNFSLKFKKLSGKTLTQYINYERIAHAERLLISTNLTITEIALDCGYNDVCYFIRVFKLTKGKSPNQFRKSGTVASVI